MDYDALTKAQRAAYLDAVARSHRRRVTLAWFRRSDGSPVSSITNRFLGGSIKGDESRDPVTVLECTLLDEEYALDWSHGAHRKYRVRVTDSRFVVALDDWVDAVVFTGPVWEFDRQGPEVRLVVEGPEVEAQGSIRTPDTWQAKTLATTALRRLLDRAGVAWRIPRLKRKLPRDVTVSVKVGRDRNRRRRGFQGRRKRFLRVGRDDTYWAEAEAIAEALDRDLYGHADGALVLASKRSRPSHRLEQHHLLSPVVEKPASTEEGPNTWHVYGANPQGPKPRIHVKGGLPKRHPSSAHSRRLNDKDREVIETVQNKNLRGKRAARNVLERRRSRAMREQMTYEVEALPVIPWLRPSSLVSVPVAAGRASARASQWDLPLGPGAEPLRIGANRREGWQR